MKFKFGKRENATHCKYYLKVKEIKVHDISIANLIFKDELCDSYPMKNGKIYFMRYFDVEKKIEKINDYIRALNEIKKFLMEV